jgi:hypothetical protein
MGRINPTPIIEKKALGKNGTKPPKVYPKTECINDIEIRRRKEAGKCLRCAWPSDRKGTHQVKDCIRPIKLDKGTAGFPKANEYPKQQLLDSSHCSDTDNSESSN